MKGSRLGKRRASARNCSRLGSAVRKASCRVLIGQSAILKSALQGSRLQLQSRLRNQKIVNCAWLTTRSWLQLLVSGPACPGLSSHSQRSGKDKTIKSVCSIAWWTMAPIPLTFVLTPRVASHRLMHPPAQWCRAIKPTWLNYQSWKHSGMQSRIAIFWTRLDALMHKSNTDSTTIWVLNTSWNTRSISKIMVIASNYITQPTNCIGVG